MTKLATMPQQTRIFNGRKYQLVTWHIKTKVEAADKVKWLKQKGVGRARVIKFRRSYAIYTAK